MGNALFQTYHNSPNQRGDDMLHYDLRWTQLHKNNCTRSHTDEHKSAPLRYFCITCLNRVENMSMD